MKRQPQSSESPTRRRHILRTIGNALLIASLLVFPCCLTGLVCSGWISHADHYGAEFRTYGIWMLLLSGGMTLAVILYCLHKDLAAAICGALSYLPGLALMGHAVQIAEQMGWTGQTAANFGKNAADVWTNGLAGNAIPFVLLLLLSLTRFLSYDEILRRAEHKAQKIAKDNAPAPSILAPMPAEDSTDSQKP